MAAGARGTYRGVELGVHGLIGVIADSADHDVAREFFELFKTPWEFYHRDRHYDVVLSAGDAQPDTAAELVLHYAGRRLHIDDTQRIRDGRKGRADCSFSYQGNRIPIYGDAITFPEKGNSRLTDQDSQESAAYLENSGSRVLARIGYDLFSEVRTLLTVGQPPANASIPALELHIALLRDLIVECGIPLVEIPPVPDGYQFVACLTHDVDHPAIRQHKFDHTTFGFVYRAMLGSLLKLIRGQMSVQDLLRNWAAAIKLPFVHMGLAKDYWREFDDRYLEMENGLHSTFFVIPFSGQPGRTASGPAPAMRAARYRARDLTDAIRNLTAAGCEVGLHGIDAWLDGSSGRQELEEIRQLTGAAEVGVRMHWLYFDQDSPIALETAGAAYDSTIGYNGTVGYRAGTTQVYKPLGASRLLELPLHVMDTALFYPSHLALSPRQAKALLGPMLENAVQFGGALTVNWHDRSLAPERLWGECYRELIQDLQNRGAWFATAGQATAWFRKRRAAEFETTATDSGTIRAKAATERGDDLPGLRLRVRKARRSDSISSSGPADFVDVTVGEGVEARVAS
jgi:peptidoglycan/xylan/chitin deacetylase (PgdA/CDA1 family)